MLWASATVISLLRRTRDSKRVETELVEREINRASESVSAMEEVELLHPRSPIPLIQLPVKLLDAQRTDEAAKVYDKLELLFSKSPARYWISAEVPLAPKFYDEAERQVALGLTRCAPDLVLGIVAAEVAERKGESSLALSGWNLVRSKFPAHPKPHLQVAEHYFSVCQEDAANGFWKMRFGLSHLASRS